MLMMKSFAQVSFNEIDYFDGYENKYYLCEE